MAYLSKLLVDSTAPLPRPSNAVELNALPKEAPWRFTKPLIIALMFVLWMIPAPIVNRADLKVFGIPLLWFYYLALSILISITLTLLYLKSRGWQ